MTSEYDLSMRRNEEVRQQLVSLVNSGDYRLYSSDGKRLSIAELPAPSRQSGNANLLPPPGKLFGVRQKINKDKLCKLLNENYGAVLEQKQKKRGKRGQSGLNDSQKKFIESRRKRYGAQCLYEALESRRTADEEDGSADITSYSTDSESDARVDFGAASDSVDSDLLTDGVGTDQQADSPTVPKVLVTSNSVAYGQSTCQKETGSEHSGIRSCTPTTDDTIQVNDPDATTLLYKTRQKTDSDAGMQDISQVTEPHVLDVPSEKTSLTEAQEQQSQPGINAETSMDSKLFALELQKHNAVDKANSTADDLKLSLEPTHNDADASVVGLDHRHSLALQNSEHDEHQGLPENRYQTMKTSTATSEDHSLPSSIEMRQNGSSPSSSLEDFAMPEAKGNALSSPSDIPRSETPGEMLQVIREQETNDQAMHVLRHASYHQGFNANHQMEITGTVQETERSLICCCSREMNRVEQQLNDLDTDTDSLCYHLKTDRKEDEVSLLPKAEGLLSSSNDELKQENSSRDPTLMMKHSAAGDRSVDKGSNNDASPSRTTQEDIRLAAMRPFPSAEQQRSLTSFNIKLEEQALPTGDMLEPLSAPSSPSFAVSDVLQLKSSDTDEDSYTCTPQEEDIQFGSQNQVHAAVDNSDFSRQEYSDLQEHADLQRSSDRTVETSTERSLHISGTFEGSLDVNGSPRHSSLPRTHGTQQTNGQVLKISDHVSHRQTFSSKPDQLECTGTADGVQQETSTLCKFISPEIETTEQQLNELDTDTDDLKTDRELSDPSTSEKTRVETLTTVFTPTGLQSYPNDMAKRKIKRSIPFWITESSQPSCTSVGKSGPNDNFSFATAQGTFSFRSMPPFPIADRQESTATLNIKQEEQSLPSYDNRPVLSPQSSPSSDVSESILRYESGNTEERFQDSDVSRTEQDRDSSGEPVSLVAALDSSERCPGIANRNEVIVISSGEEGGDEPNAKVPRLQPTVQKRNNGLDISDDELYPASTRQGEDALAKDITRNIPPAKAQLAKNRLAFQEGHKAHQQFAQCIGVSDVYCLIKPPPRWIYVSADFNVCLSGQADILKGNYLFEVKNSLASPIKKPKLSKADIRECQFYMMLCQIDCAFFVVEHAKQIFVVHYNPDVFEETKHYAEELAKFYRRGKNKQ